MNVQAKEEKDKKTHRKVAQKEHKKNHKGFMGKTFLKQ